MKNKCDLKEISTIDLTNSDIIDDKNKYQSNFSIYNPPPKFESKLAYSFITSSGKSQQINYEQIANVNLEKGGRVCDLGIGVIFVSSIKSGMHGILKVSTLDIGCKEFIQLHTQGVRDIKFNPTSEILLTASSDKSVILSHSRTNNILHAYKVDASVWSCEWNKDNPNYFYCGASNQKLYSYDIRQTSGPVLYIDTPQLQPVIKFNITNY